MIQQELAFADNLSSVAEQDLVKYPYDCIGLVVCKFAGSDQPTIGTGFLIGQRQVLTSASNLYRKGINGTQNAV